MNHIKATMGEKWAQAALYLLMSTIVLVTVFPFWNQLVVSLSTSSSHAVYSTGTLLFPAGFTLDSYKFAFHYDSLWKGYGNTLLRVTLGVILSLVFTSLLAYPLSKADLPGNRIVTALILFTMLFSGGLIPHYLLIKKLGLFNSVWALVLPNMIGAFNVLIMRNFFKSIPDSLQESAKVDGAGYFLIFRKIVIPLSKPVLATVALWVAVGHWNAWFDSLIYITDTNKQVLQVVLRKIIVDNNMDEINAMLYQSNQFDAFSSRQLQSTIIMLSVIPMLVAYPFAQKYFVKGIMLGAVKE
ncbi:carbohydrate ABC transporter permease [Paenibacillus radicis (ex Xue et al. 2023)]|uniref:Carbohydrate ABC transporter permease n=1 Tax=Paenibacillus radicis (ex Xue et al. 2023) TaxID=2972489 RepID=A0ABT1YGR7_9BACL|nr:carbohydrate ABC transporter permease [Paenibacillus radicis (ex Xue et al. 2023)]MCR8631589.1 carbohydrate ABC transporter permease [Paenibacillus radicis (ex Xue et al. 2023)]